METVDSEVCGLSRVTRIFFWKGMLLFSVVFLQCLESQKMKFQVKYLKNKWEN